MGLLALDIILSLLGVRGPVPRFDDFRPVPPTPAGGPNNTVRALAAMIGIFLVLSLTVCVAVWLIIQTL